MASDFLPIDPFVSLLEISRNLLFIRVFRAYSGKRTTSRVQSFGLGRDSQVSTLVPLPSREGMEWRLAQERSMNNKHTFLNELGRLGRKLRPFVSRFLVTT
jgi:hypothetical protein